MSDEPYDPGACPYCGSVNCFCARAYREAAEHSEGMRGLLADVAEFHRACEQPILREPTVPSEERVALRAKLIWEEAGEAFEALCCEFSEDGERIYQAQNTNIDLEQLSKELCDLIYVTVGTALEFGIDLWAVWDAVQTSNMSKLGPDGKAIKRADGKIQKGPNYVPPDIKSALWGK